MSFENLCAARKVDLLEFSECTEHPFVYLVKGIECVSRYGGRFELRAPAGTIPITVLEDYSKKYGVKYSVSRQKHERLPIDVEVFVIER